jgi:hypothetical protein
MLLIPYCSGAGLLVELACDGRMCTLGLTHIEGEVG